LIKFQDHVDPCKGDFHIDVYKKGKMLQTIDDHNLVVDFGRIRLAELAAGTKPGQHIAQIGVGSGADVEDVSDIQLKDQQLFPLAGATVSGRDVRFDFMIDTNQANGLKIHEFALFCVDNTMFSHRVRPGVIEKADDIQLKGYWILHF